MLRKLFGYLLFLVLVISITAIITLHYLYRPIKSGTLYLKNARGNAEIIRETENNIPHIFADTEEMAIYA